LRGVAEIFTQDARCTPRAVACPVVGTPFGTRDNVQFIDLQTQRARMGTALEDAILKVVRSGQYILGPEVADLEGQLAAFCGAKHALTVANGTDALALGLMAFGVKPRDAILVPSFTFAATGEVVVWLGATPIFVDCLPDTFNMDPASLETGIKTAKQLGLKPVGVIPVDLFGLPADYDAIEPICKAHDMWMMADTAQGFGGKYKGRKTGSIGNIASTSFFPAKPLGCYGDGGALFFDDDALREVLVSLRVHGQGADKYDNVRVGMNGRMDTIQAAVLLEKLKLFPGEIDARNRIAQRYSDALAKHCIVPRVPENLTSVWAQYTVRIPGGKRDKIAASLKDAGIPTAVYYVKPMHRQTAYARYPVAGGGLPVSDALSFEVLSLPMHPYLAEADQNKVVDAFVSALRA
jgi:dTDP-4-amino-4,6-dideoxygalactose transaminase